MKNENPVFEEVYLLSKVIYLILTNTNSGKVVETSCVPSEQKTSHPSTPLLCAGTLETRDQPIWLITLLFSCQLADDEMFFSVFIIRKILSKLPIFIKRFGLPFSNIISWYSSISFLFWQDMFTIWLFEILPVFMMKTDVWSLSPLFYLHYAPLYCRTEMRILHTTRWCWILICCGEEENS